MTAAALTFGGCDGKSPSARVEKPQQVEFAEFGDPGLSLGRKIWVATCKACHAAGVAGAPKVSDSAAWTRRAAQGKDVLYEHAINGFYGPDYTYMPPRGGNAALTDEQVRAAVDYMIALAVR